MRWFFYAFNSFPSNLLLCKKKKQFSSAKEKKRKDDLDEIIMMLASSSSSALAYHELKSRSCGKQPSCKIWTHGIFKEKNGAIKLPINFPIHSIPLNKNYVRQRVTRFCAGTVRTHAELSCLGAYKKTTFFCVTSVQ